MLQKYSIPFFNNWKQNRMLHQCINFIWKQNLLLHSKQDKIASELIIDGSCSNVLSVFNKRKNYFIDMPETAQISSSMPIFDSWGSDPLQNVTVS